jgi:hypothetical protein
MLRVCFQQGGIRGQTGRLPNFLSAEAGERPVCPALVCQMTKIYCEHGAVPKGINKLGRDRHIEIVHFPYDPNSHIPKIAGIATPSSAKIRNLNLPIKELPGSLADYSGSTHFDEIISIVGSDNREDAPHIDSAFKHGCSIFLTKDKRDILAHRKELRRLLGIKFFHPDEWRWRLQSLLLYAGGSILDRL